MGEPKITTDAILRAFRRAPRIEDAPTIPAEEFGRGGPLSGPTETVVLEGGPYGDAGTEYPYLGVKLYFGPRVEVEASLWAAGLDRLISTGAAGTSRMLDVAVVYADSGRRTADGRRVFVVEGG